jgi:hypothetical protein
LLSVDAQFSGEVVDAEVRCLGSAGGIRDLFVRQSSVGELVGERPSHVGDGLVQRLPRVALGVLEPQVDRQDDPGDGENDEDQAPAGEPGEQPRRRMPDLYPRHLWVSDLGETAPYDLFIDGGAGGFRVQRFAARSRHR